MMGLVDAHQLPLGIGVTHWDWSLPLGDLGGWNTIQELHCCEKYLDLFWSSCCAITPLSFGVLVSLLRVGGSWWVQPDPQLPFAVGLSFLPLCPKDEPTTRAGHP